MRGNRASTSTNGIECFLHAMANGAKVRAPEFTEGDDGVMACRTNAVTSRTYVSTGRSGQAFRYVPQSLRACWGRFQHAEICWYLYHHVADAYGS
jgi:hypothetical protein